MSAFSEYLQQYMQKNEITAAMLAKSLNAERTGVFRYVKGTRIPASMDMVNGIAYALKMNSDERRNLVKAYEYEVYGKEVVDNYEGIKKLFEEMEKKKEPIEMPLDDLYEYDEEMEGIFTIEGREELVYALIRIAKSAIGRKGKKKLYVCMQPRYSIVQKHLLKCLEREDIEIEQILCFEQRRENNKDNLNTYSELLPACFQYQNYKIYYYYDDMERYSDTLKWLPNIIIAETMVIQFDEKMTDGVLIVNKQFRDFMKKQYDKKKKNTQSLIKKLDRLEKIYPFRDEYNDDLCKKMISIFKQPCFGNCISSDIYNKNLYDFSNREQWIDACRFLNGDWDGEVYHNARENKGKIISYFSKNGIIDFVKNGRVSEFPDALYKELDFEQRKMVLKRMKILYEMGYAEYYIVDEELTLPQEYYFYMMEDKHQIIINNICEEGVKQIEISELGLCQSVEDFIEYITKKQKIFNCEETIQWIDELLKDIE